MAGPLGYEKKVSTIFTKPGAQAPPLVFCLQEPDEYCEELVEKIIRPLLFALQDPRAVIQTLEKAFFMALLLKSSDVNLRAIAKMLDLPQDVLMNTLINYGFRVKGDVKCSDKTKKK